MDSERAVVRSHDLPDGRIPPWDGPGLRVLIVEDDDSAATSTAMLLGNLGHDTQIASDGAVALGAASTYNPDVVLLDIGLPGLDGFEVAKRLRTQATRRRPFFIAITGRNGAEDRQRSTEAGIDLYLTKPVDNGQLEKVLARFNQLFQTSDGLPESLDV
jgi:two-component system, OmpR family, response regulator